MHRVGAIAGRNDLVTTAARFVNGPLGASHGGDNGSAILTSVHSGSLPAATAVNAGARIGLKLLNRAGHRGKDKDIKPATIVRIARFATRLWRTINGEPAEPPMNFSRGDSFNGVCTYDGALRCSLLALWQWIWPKGCLAVLRVQDEMKSNPQWSRDLGAQYVMQITEEEKAASIAEEASIVDVERLVDVEVDRQVWRGEMFEAAFKLSKGSKKNVDVAAVEQGIGVPLPPIARDAAFRQGGWIASAANQRRKSNLDGGSAVTKLRLTVKNSSDV